MKPLPLPVRLAAGLVATAVEQAMDLPRLVAELPITAVSQTLQASMRVQQKVTELAIKGDRALSVLHPVEEKPSWATFDDDLDESDFDGPAHTNGATTVTELRPPRREVTPIDVARPRPEPDDEAPEDRFDAVSDLDDVADAEALDLIESAEDDEDAGRMPDIENTPVPGAGPAALPEYPTLTIPQLRGRLRHLSVAELETLLTWENAHQARAPYVTMLANRITTVTE